MSTDVDIEAARRAGDLSQRGGPLLTESDIYDLLKAAILTHVPGSIPIPDMGVDRVASLSLFQKHLWIFEGYHGATVRFAAHAGMASQDIARIHQLVATRGTLHATADLLGAPRPRGRGNSLLVCRLLHVAVYTLRDAGVEAVSMNPLPVDNLRKHYRAMGFDEDWVLDLTNSKVLERCLGNILEAYEEYALPLNLPPL